MTEEGQQVEESVNVSAHRGYARGEIPLSVDHVPGIYVLEVRDAASGLAVKWRFDIRPGGQPRP